MLRVLPIGSGSKKMLVDGEPIMSRIYMLSIEINEFPHQLVIKIPEKTDTDSGPCVSKIMGE